MSKWLVIAGALIMALGVLLHFAPWSLNWFGRLPGDINIETAQGKVFIPLVSMLVVSIVLTIIINILKRF